MVIFHSRKNLGWWWDGLQGRHWVRKVCTQDWAKSKNKTVQRTKPSLIMERFLTAILSYSLHVFVFQVLAFIILEKKSQALVINQIPRIPESSKCTPEYLGGATQLIFFFLVYEQSFGENVTCGWKQALWKGLWRVWSCWDSKLLTGMCLSRQDVLTLLFPHLQILALLKTGM